MNEIGKALKKAKNRPCCRRTIWSMISFLKNSKLTSFDFVKIKTKTLAKTRCNFLSNLLGFSRILVQKVYLYTKGKKTSITNQKLQGQLWSNLCRLIDVRTKFQNFKSSKFLIKNCCIIPVGFGCIYLKCTYLQCV